MTLTGLGDTQTYDCSAGPSNACAWYDNIYATDGCLGWYAQCNPTSAFYLTNTKGLIVGGAAVLGQGASDAVGSFGNSLLGLDPSQGIPNWIWVAAAGLVAFELLKK